ncbi:DUF3021 family protein [Lactococcus termiticola]|uniref:DUF3021 domain-containing protein n=1 Tax=Lactococcus termiticola TaxID=2169526 RepID=A0A2R5HG36_9LACT|nr:DUF3021 family protein [Lactococcus termiticola]GBG97027.1 hypothetical protein NtB2_01164 [Lactococcus termiticola]
MRILKSIGLGVVVASLCMVIMAAIYWNTWMVTLTLIQGAAQGLVAVLVYGFLKAPYLIKFISHALLSYLLAFAMLLLNHQYWQVNLLTFSVEWLLIFALVYLYIYWRNRTEARRLNEKIVRLRK